LIRQHTTSSGTVVDIEVTEVGHFYSEDFSFKVVKESYKHRNYKVLLVEKFPERMNEYQINEMIKVLQVMKELL
jgi:hypothetical protein